MPTRDSIPHRLLAQAAKNPTGIAYQHKVAGQYQPTTWRAYADEVRTAGRALIALGLPRGGKVTILGFNRPEWVIFDHAAMMAGGVPAGIYTTCSTDEVQYIIHHSESLVMLVENAAQLAKVTARRAQLPLLKTIVMMRGAVPPEGSTDVLSWEDFMARASAVPDSKLDERLDAIEQAELATLIYTSGTTGPPKGVMLSHDNLSWTSQALIEVGGGRSHDEIALSYLPLSHIAEQMTTIHMPTTVGATVYFAESLDKMSENLKECRPTIFFGVPRVWEKFHAGIAQKLAGVTGVKKKLVAWSRKVATQVNALRDRGEPLPRWLDVQYRLAQKLVLAKLRAALGFDRARSMITSAAPISPDVLHFFASIDLPLREVYGQSEVTGPTSYSIPGKTKIGSVGPAFPGMQVKIADDGEIVVSGPNVFMGYFKEPEATAEVMRDGWLYSGDLGAFDADGFLAITGRKKEIIITAGGKNIAPKNIEAAIKQLPLVTEAVVIGDRRKYLTALITIDEAAAKEIAPDEKAESTALGQSPQIRAAIQAQIDQVNETLSRVEQVKKFAVLARPFGIDTGELTPTMKIKRKVVAERYAAEIEAMYVEMEALEVAAGRG